MTGRRPTVRERQVANALFLGFGNREIAAQLGNREATVKKQVMALMDKAGRSTRSELFWFMVCNPKWLDEVREWPRVRVDRETRRRELSAWRDVA